MEHWSHFFGEERKIIASKMRTKQENTKKEGMMREMVLTFESFKKYLEHENKIGDKTFVVLDEL